MKTYADVLRQKVLLAVDAHQGSYPFLARIFHVSASWSKSVVRRRYRTGNVHALVYRRGPAPKFSPALLAWMRLEVEHHPEVTEKQLCQRLLASRGVSVSQPTVSRALASLGLPRKKR
jgi:transposase